MPTHPLKWLPMSAGPNQRAGLSEPPVSGPSTMTPRPSAPPIASAAHATGLGVEGYREHGEDQDEGADALDERSPGSRPPRSGLIFGVP